MSDQENEPFGTPYGSFSFRIIETNGSEAHNIVTFFRDEEKMAALDDLLSEITLEQESAREGASLSGKTFVVTGAVHLFANRDALKDFIEARGGKVASAVSSKTDYLINNDVTSTSGKNKKAKELGIPVISEEDFMKIAEE